MACVGRLPQTGLYAILNTQGRRPEDLHLAAEQTLAGGVVLLQLRDKGGDSKYRLQCALAVREACAARAVPLLINDDSGLAARAGAAGVHLGRSDGDIAAARRRLGEKAIIGASCHADLDYAGRAISAGADYVSFGRFFASNTKPHAPAADITVLTRARARLSVPVVAIGGINADNGLRLLDAGADLLAVSGAIFDQSGYTDAARALANLFHANQ